MMKPALRTKLAQRTEDDHFRGGAANASAQIAGPGPGSDNLPFSGVGGPTAIATTSTSGGAIRSVSAERLDGSTVTLWVDRNAGSGQDDVRGTVIAANGTVLVPSFNVSLSPAGQQELPAVEVRNSDGAFFAAWRSPATNAATIRAQLFDANGARIGSEIEVTSAPLTGGIASTGLDPYLEIASLSDGGFMLVWQIYLTHEIRAQRFDATGAELGAEISLIPNDQTVTGTQHQLVSAHQLPSGELAVTIRETVFTPNSSETHGYLRTFDLAGVPTDTAEIFPDGGGASLAATAFAADGSSISLWKAQNGTVFFQPFDATGEKIGGPVVLSPQLDPPFDITQQIADNLVALPNGEYMFVWTGPAFSGTGNSIFGRTFSIDGVRTSPTFELATNSFVGGGTRPLVVTDVTAEDDGSIVLTWNAASAGGQTLMTQRFEPQPYPPSGTFTGTPGIDNLVGGTGDDVINALASNDRLYGGTGNDKLDGGTGNDVTDGGAGDDFHIVDSQSDTVIELANEGYDNVLASVSFVLAADVFVEVLSTADHGGTALINLTGNNLLNVVIGNAAKNVLNGGSGGADLLVGLGGDDFLLVDADDRVYEAVGGGYDNVHARATYVLAAGAEIEVLSTDNHDGGAAINLTGNEFGQVVIGNAGNNFLDGGGGADLLVGLGGDDFLFVDADDRVYESAVGGYDNVIARASYVLTAGAEVEVLSTDNHAGTAAINLTGNEFGQVVIGNAGNNYLDGGGGADLLVGFAGNDTYIVDADDRVIEGGGAGLDNVAAKTSFTLEAGQEIEVLSTTNHAGTAGIYLVGNEFGQVLIGNAGANVLDGGLGNDLLQGMAGADEFTFTTALGAGNVDTILDFAPGTDRIVVDNAVFSELPNGALNPNAFFAGAAAHDADDRIIYDSATGRLYYDADGNGAGAQIQFATLTGAPTITATDFTVI